MTIQEALHEATGAFTSAGLEAPSAESEFLLAALLGRSRADVLLHRAQALSQEQTQRFQEWLKQRLDRYPLAYVTGEQPFYGHSLSISPDVLVPRPETELLVEQVERWLNQASQRATIVDVGTGSGAIAIALSRHRNATAVFAVDVSDRALAIAQRNASSCHAPIVFLLGNLLRPFLEAGAQADVIVANLPYIRRDVLASLTPEVRHEPRIALDGGEDGLDLIRRLIAQAPQALVPGGVIFLEIGFDQGDAVQAILQDAGNWESVTLYKDLAGHPRIVRAIRRG